jgi:hypothetical protein
VIIPPRIFHVASARSRPYLALLALPLFFAPVLLSQELKQRSAPARPAVDLHGDQPSDNSAGVIALRRLNPPLRAAARLRFSSDGSHLLIQDQAGIFVLSHQPLHILLYADIGKAYPAAFSSDSQSVSILGRDLVLTTWHLSDPHTPERRELRVQHGCLDAQLSPDAAWIACFTPEFVLDLYRTGDLQRVYSQRLGSAIPGAALVPIARNRDSPFSIPFGFMSADITELADRGTFRSAIYFAPDAKFLLVNEATSSFQLDLPSLRKSPVPGAIHKIAHGILGLFADDRALVSLPNPKKDPVRQIVSLSTGNVVAPVVFTAETAVLASNPRFALLMNFDVSGVTVFDLEKNTELATPPNLGADVYGDELVLCNAEGELRLYHLCEQRSTVVVRLPLGPFPSLGSALADPSLTTLALSLQGSGAAFDLATGNRLSALRTFHGLSFAAADSAFLGVLSRGKAFPAVLHWAKSQPNTSDMPAWTTEKALDLIPSRSAFISYAFHDDIGFHAPMVSPRGEVPFELRGLDPATGRELWHHEYGLNAPVPFSDPQGTRIVLGWRAHTSTAETQAKRFPAAREAFKKSKLKDQDSFFEVLDASSGASLGGVLVQFGSGPVSFDSAFCVGNFLFLIKDAYRLSVFRLSDGALLGRFRGNYPAANDAAKLFALDDGTGKLTLYNLQTAARLAERHFPDHIDYLCFSEKGDRLLVLTAHQVAYLLDVKKTIEAFPAAPAPATESAEPPENP